LIYSNSIRKETKEKNPELNNKELLSLIGTMWSDLSPEDKKVRLFFVFHFSFVCVLVCLLKTDLL
jgi:hypothetical protein